MSLTSLFLAPKAIDAAPGRAAVIRVLEDLEIVGAPLIDGLFRAGEGFSRHVIFAGCSPHLALQPPDDGGPAFCHVGVHGPWPHARLVTGPNTVRPRCPHCRGGFDEWRERLARWHQDGERAMCPSCGRASAPCRLDWRAHAACGRLLVELRNVYPAEASPSDTLLDRLARETGMAWRHAWAGYLDEDRRSY